MTAYTNELADRARYEMFLRGEDDAGGADIFSVLTNNFTKGCIIYKKEKRKSGSNGNVRTYIYAYLEVVSYENGVRKRTQKYIRKSELNRLKERLAQKQQTRKRYREAARNLRKWERKFQKYQNSHSMDLNMRSTFMAQVERDKCLTNHKHYENLKKIITISGERVRSRGECIIANMLYSLGIVSQYEPLITQTCYNRTTRRRYLEFAYPDFVVFINNKMFLIELLGMSDDKDYWENWERKEEKYKEMGYVKGENLICFTCDDGQDFDSQQVMQTLLDIMEKNVVKSYVKIG